MFYNFHFFFFFFAKPSMDFIQLWCNDRALSKLLCVIPIPVHDLKIKVPDFEFFYVKSLQCQLLQSLWLIWIVSGMNGYTILKCFRKEKCVSGELSCPATGLTLELLALEWKNISQFWTWISLKPVGLSWSNFIRSIIGVGERLHKVLGQIESKLWFPC